MLVTLFPFTGEIEQLDSNLIGAFAEFSRLLQGGDADTALQLYAQVSSASSLDEAGQYLVAIKNLCNHVKQKSQKGWDS